MSRSCLCTSSQHALPSRPPWWCHFRDVQIEKKILQLKRCANIQSGQMTVDTCKSEDPLSKSGTLASSTDSTVLQTEHVARYSGLKLRLFFSKVPTTIKLHHPEIVSNVHEPLHPRSLPNRKHTPPSIPISRISLIQPHKRYVEIMVCSGMVSNPEAGSHGASWHMSHPASLALLVGWNMLKPNIKRDERRRKVTNGTGSCWASWRQCREETRRKRFESKGTDKRAAYIQNWSELQVENGWIVSAFFMFLYSWQNSAFDSRPLASVGRNKVPQRETKQGPQWQLWAVIHVCLLGVLKMRENRAKKIEIHGNSMHIINTYQYPTDSRYPQQSVEARVVWCKQGSKLLEIRRVNWLLCDALK